MPQPQQPPNLQARRGATISRSGRLLSTTNCILISLATLIIPLLLVHHALWEPETLASIHKSVHISNPSSDHLRLHKVVSCPAKIQTRNADGIFDPNKGMDESPKRYTVTDPPFWISLHKKYFDNMRWVSIMDRGNYYETGITEQFHEILGNATVKGLVLDIGMNIGWFTLYSRAHGHSVAAFEPNPVMHTRVCESLILNNWHRDGSVQIFPYGLGKEESMMNLTTGNNPGSSSFIEERLAKKFRKSLPVQVVTVDSIAIQEGWFKDDSPPIYLMKVDVEGYEPIVFQGGMQLLQSGKVENILMENSVTDMRQKAGYKIKWVSSVNGQAYHPEALPQIEEELSKATVGMELDGVGEALKFLVKVNCNLWWTKR
ncbi:hypothetical protein ACHAXN_009156 [Cyclotella atomus]